MKILMMTKNWIGDILFEFPAIEAIKSYYPDSEIACIAPKRCREILENHPDVDRVIEFDERGEQKSLWRRLLFILRLRREKWDQVYLFHRSRTRAFIMLLAGVRERFGFKGKRQLFLTKSVEEPVPNHHQVDHFLKMLEGIGISSGELPSYRFFYKTQDEKNADALIQKHGLKHYVCFHLGANWLPKRWPPESFARLADMLSERWGLTIVVTGAKRDIPLAEEMIRHVQHARVIVLAGQTTIGEAGVIFKRANFMISGDSGPLHIASGVGTRTLSLFGPTNPVQTGPRGIGEKIVVQYIPPGYEAPWYGDDLPKEGWLSQIRPEDVFDALEQRGWNRLPDSDHSQSDWVYPVQPKPEAAETPAQTGKIERPRRVLFITLTNIGDVILTTPVLMNLAHQYTDAEFTVVAGPKAEGLLSGSHFIDELIIYDKKVSLWSKLKFILKLRKKKYDVVVDLRNSAIPYLVSAKRRSPFVRKHSAVLFRDKHIEVLKMMRLPALDVPPFDFFHLKDERKVFSRLQDLGIGREGGWIVVAPAAASGLKTWRLEGFREVIEKMIEAGHQNILLVGNEREKQWTGELAGYFSSHVHDLAGSFTFREVGALIAHASLLLTNDSALMHTGYELNRPVAAIFGPTHHEKYGRRGPSFRIVREAVPCSPCGKPVCRYERQHCFEDLKAEKVFAACQELLHEPVAATS